jgi:protein-L-isoaspartate(D-aspartate) O-methyltransferase
MKESHNYYSNRMVLVEGLRHKGIEDENVLKAFSTVEREKFISNALAHRAYEDIALPIGSAQTISQPYTVAVMTECLNIKPGDKILEIGTGSGYQAAILYEMGAKVFTIERLSDLGLETRKLFDKMNLKIITRIGDGSIGWSEFAPYNGIIITAAAPEAPKSLLRQLTDKGRLVAPIGDLDSQDIFIMERKGDDYLTTKKYGFKFVPLIGKEGWQLNNK